MTLKPEPIKELESEIGVELKECDINEIKFRKTMGFSVNENGYISVLKLDQVKLVDFPSGISGFQYLKVLSLSSTGISDISFLQSFGRLTHLNLSFNQIDDISSLKHLNELVYLSLSFNKIRDVTPLHDLIKLRDLNLSSNHIDDISTLKELKHITGLNLSLNDIMDISSLESLNNLKKLFLRKNKIVDISPLQNLKDLIILDLSENEITELPKKITKYGLKINVVTKSGYEQGIYLYGNRLVKPPMEIVRKGDDAIKVYFESLGNEERNLNEMKVLIVGDGGVGKTSLLKRLLEDKFDKNEPQTHGINIRQREIKVDRKTIIVNLWDFGGQEIMHATHQFFFSRRSLYILVLELRVDSQIDYWLKHIESFGGDSPVLVVINKIDENPEYDVNRRLLTNKYKNIKGVFRLSCATKDGFEYFLKQLSSEIAKVEFIHTTWPQNWFNVKVRLESTYKYFINYQQYRDLCTKEKIEDATCQLTLLDFLNDLGVVIHFEDPELEDTYILDPKWVTGAVYKIINSRKLSESKGVLNLTVLKKILEKKNQEDYDYPRDKCRFIINLMKKFELCFTLDSRNVLIPDLLEAQEPAFKFEYGSALKFIIEYDFLPRSIMPRFTVNRHKEIKDRIHWRTGVVLEDEYLQTTAVVKADNDLKRIYIYVNGVQKRHYFVAILKTLIRISEKFSKLRASCLVPMPDDLDITVNSKHLIRLEESGAIYYLPPETENCYKVKELLASIGANPDGDETSQDIRKIITSCIQGDKE